MIEFIHWRDQLIGIFIPHAYHTPKTEFFTPLEEPLQCGVGVFKSGAMVAPHRHVGEPTGVKEFQEFIFIRSGRVRAEVFDLEGKSLRKIEMLPGDGLLLLRGGHAFYFLEDTELLEVKQGPYKGREMMKQLIQEFSSEISIG